MENRVHDIEVKREQGKVSIWQRNRNVGHRTDVDFHFWRLSTRRAVQLEYSPVRRREGTTKSYGIAKAPTESQAGYFSAKYRLIKI